MIALVGMATKFAEASLGVKYRHVAEDGTVSGGVMYYIEKGLGPRWKWLALLYAFLAGLAAFGIGNMTQANTVAAALDTGFGLDRNLTALLIVLGVGIVTMGGVKRIGRLAERLVPAMVIVYVAGALIILLLNIGRIPGAFQQIFYYAFNPAPAVGGFAGAMVAASIRYGIARGIFSNEAGLGSASIVHAQASNTPVRQGMWGMWEVFIDTIIVATMTALVILVTGVMESGSTGAALASEAFTTGLPGPGGFLVIVSLVLFAYTTMLTWNFYGEKSWEYLFGPRVVLFYRILFLLFLAVGARGALEAVWDVADTLNGLMAAPNLIALIALAGILVKTKNAYLQELRSGETDARALRNRKR
jgi:alanine or glycine:cation symporter, AGCS family